MGSRASDAGFLAGGGMAGELMRSKDWSTTSFGPLENWPQSLQSAVSICLGSGFPIAIYWGDDCSLLYNDAWSSILGTKHPWALGRPGKEVWPEIWDEIGPQFSQVFATGEATYSKDKLLAMHRFGFVEECYFDYTFSPIRSEAGRVGGIFNAAIETTSRVISERRNCLLRDLGEAIADASTIDEIWDGAVPVFESNLADLPFSLMYVSEKNHCPRLVASTGLSQVPHLLARISERRDIWPPLNELLVGKTIFIDDLAAHIGCDLYAGPWPEKTEHAQVSPLINSSGDIDAILITGISPRLEFDTEYKTFLARIATTLTVAIGRVKAFENERRRMEALAELDSAKTVFFSNVSHELRTPLTLILGPLENLLRSDNHLDATARHALDLAHRNSLRLLRLVNTLLDFSRIEAGRVETVFEQTDLSRLTCELVSAFSSAIEKAGLTLTTEYESLADAEVFVDRVMWEKIVFNLLSNALKYTFQGEKNVSLKKINRSIIFSVSDTGTGIPQKEIVHLFERFYRVPNSQGRTHEGTGIGLALVQELVKLHGGNIEVESILGTGSIFTVTIPVGCAHLPREHLHGENNLPSTAIVSDAFIEEAMTWLPQKHEDEQFYIPDFPEIATNFSKSLPLHAHVVSKSETGIIVLADDNADMRDYVRNLLVKKFTVYTAADGEEAFELIQQHSPDLVLSDIMMPRLDGIGLLNRIRNDVAIADIPLILLSARAGEEALIDGFNAGADDYLIKPFSARELVARVNTHLRLYKLRAQARALLHDAEDIRWQAMEKLNQHLLTQSEKLEHLFEKSPGFMALLTGKDRVYELSNAAHRSLIGNRDVVGKPLFEALPELRNQESPKLLDKVFETGEPYVAKAMRVLLQRTPGAALEERFLDFIYQPFIAEGHAEVTSVFVEGYDVTDRVHAEQLLQQASRRKDEFLATLAHELRNPLSALSAASQLLARSVDKPAIAATAYESLNRQIHHMSRLLDDLLEVSRITHGRMELRNEKHDLRDSVSAAVESVTSIFESKKHHLTVDMPLKSVFVNGDKVRLTQLFANLLTNAAKYTDGNGRIHLLMRVDDNETEITIKDNGIGILPEMLSEVFEMFSQAKPALNRAEGGLGIGLALVRGLVKLHGGSIEAKSEGLGHGSEFIVRLPRVHVHENNKNIADITPQNAVAGKLKILVADDNIDSVTTWAMLLELSGHEVHTAHDGLRAFEMMKDIRPDLAMLDVGMPEMNGYELAQHIRNESWGKNIVLVAVTGWGQENDKQQAKAAGFDHHFTKPLNIQSFELLLSQVAHEKEQTKAQEKNSTKNFRTSA